MVSLPNVYLSFISLQIISIAGDGSPTPINFPPTIPIKKGTFVNWANDLQVSNLWIATPANEDDIVTLANWAKQNSYKLRASGYMHTWSPVTVTQGYNGNVVLIDTTAKLTNVQEPQPITSTKYSVTVQTGATMEQVLTFLENKGLGMYAVPAAGDLTVGGVLAIGGHGTGIPSVGEIIPDGQALGTISNLVISFKAVVWDEATNQYVLKTFQRSDVDAKAFLVNFGRTFITEVTLMVGKNYNLRCESYTTISTDELYSLTPGSRTLSSFLDKSGRIETVKFPYTNTPWLKVWTVTPTKPLLSRQVSQPFNYVFAENQPPVVSNLLGQIFNGSYALTPTLGATMLSVTTLALISTYTNDMWGPSKNLLLYTKPTTVRETTNGLSALTNRSNIQKVLNVFNTKFDALVSEYQRDCKYPFNGPMTIRITSLDNPNVGTDDESPAFSAIHPFEEHPQYDVAVWINIASMPNTPHFNEAMTALEQIVLNEFNGTYASVRPEWSKGWAYTNESAWSNTNFIRTFIPSTFSAGTSTDGWNWAVETLDKYDPNRIFTNSFLDALLQTV